MKALFTVIIILCSLFVKGDYWARMADFGGVARVGAMGFSIGTKSYIGTGNAGAPEYQNDFWMFDMNTNTWTQKDTLSEARTEAIAFTIGSKGYMGTGFAANGGGFKNDFWEYDTTMDTWTQKADFGGAGRYMASGFSIGTKGYIGLGNNFSDFWEYDQNTNSWTEKANFGGGIREGATGFSIGSKGYFGMGNDTSNLYEDFWEYDPSTDVWTQKANFLGGNISSAKGFSIGNYGYVVTGVDSVYNSEFWEYSPAANGWTRKADFGGEGRTLAVAFSNGINGFVGLGVDSLENHLKDFWEYTPDSTTGINELSSSAFQFQIWPNPAHESLVVNYQLHGDEKVGITIFDAIGKRVFSSYYELPEQIGAGRTTNSERIDVSGLSEGLYFIVADDGRERAVRKFVED